MRLVHKDVAGGVIQPKNFACPGLKCMEIDSFRRPDTGTEINDVV